MDSLEVTTGPDGARAAVTLLRNEKPVVGAAGGKDPIAAACAAVNAAAKTDGRVTSYKILTGSAGTKRVQVEMTAAFGSVTGAGAAEESDLLTAATTAYLKAVNRFVRNQSQNKRRGETAIAASPKA